MEKQIEKLQIEYQLYTITPAQSIGELLDVMVGCVDEIDYYSDMLKLAKKKNKRARIISEALGSVAKKVGFKDLEFYDEDDRYIDIQQRMLDKFSSQLDRMFQESDEDNFGEIYRLACFTKKNYEVNNARVFEQRRANEMRYAGVSVNPSFGYENSEAFGEFFEQALRDASYIEIVEKVKK